MRHMKNDWGAFQPMNKLSAFMHRRYAIHIFAEVCVFAIVILIQVTISPAQAQQQPDPADLLQAVSSVATVGVHRLMGGAISWLSWTGHPNNVVNHSDPGRLIQQSYYAGHPLNRQAEGQSVAWSPWPWNPIQAGGIGGWARADTLLRLSDGALFGETTPWLWDMSNEVAEALMRQWTGFEPQMPNVIVVRCEFIARRNPAMDRWGVTPGNHQEIPACYFIRKFDRFRSYVGGRRWRDERAQKGPPWNQTLPPMNAMAAFDSNGNGIAVFSPSATQAWNYGPHGSEQPSTPDAGPCVHIAPIDRVPMDRRSIYRYRYWLVVGSSEELAASLDVLCAKYGGERAEFHVAPSTSN